MTKKLEELFDLPTDEGLTEEVVPDNVPEPTPENNPIMQNTLRTSPLISGSNTGQSEVIRIMILAFIYRAAL